MVCEPGPWRTFEHASLHVGLVLQQATAALGGHGQLALELQHLPAQPLGALLRLLERRRLQHRARGAPRQRGGHG